MAQTRYNEFAEFMEQHHAEETGIWSDASRWYNAEEMGLPLYPKSGKVVCEKDVSNVYKFITTDKSNLTVMVCLSASGSYVHPMIMFSGHGFLF